MLDLVYAMGRAPGAGQQAGQGNPLMSFMPIIFVFIIFYFLLIRPQKKKQKEHQAMLGKLKKGDKVVTSGGINGEVIGVKNEENIVVLKIAENVKVEFQRNVITHITKSKG
ncbi:MAG: preprotein translocase subunit YajC [Candidatus Omnitrophica bacterium]|nr:preprotein translocase subunit YajC [Candidatus Omnitrophota bacterium]